MSAALDRNQMRPALLTWGIVTLSYFGVTWGVVQSLAQNDLQRILGALATTITYSTIAVVRGRNILNRVAETNRALEASVLRQLEVEAQLRQELMERERREETLQRINAALDALNATTTGLLNRLDTQGLLSEILQRAAGLMKISHGFLFVVEPQLLPAPNHTILSVNRSFCENFFGDDPRRVIGKTRADYHDTIHRVSFYRLIETTLADTLQTSTHHLIQVPPTRREFELISTPVRTSQNEYLGHLYVFHDITQERELDRMRNEFVSMVSHELRTPLTSIKGYVDLLQSDPVGTRNDTPREFLNIVKTNTDRLVKLINDLIGRASRRGVSNCLVRPSICRVSFGW